MNLKRLADSDSNYVKFKNWLRGELDSKGIEVGDDLTFISYHAKGLGLNPPEVGVFVYSNDGPAEILDKAKSLGLKFTSLEMDDYLILNPDFVAAMQPIFNKLQEFYEFIDEHKDLEHDSYSFIGVEFPGEDLSSELADEAKSKGFKVEESPDEKGDVSLVVSIDISLNELRSYRALDQYLPNDEEFERIYDGAIPAKKRDALKEICKKYPYCDLQIGKPLSSGAVKIIIESTNRPDDLISELEKVLTGYDLRVKDLGVSGKNGNDEEFHRYSIENIKKIKDSDDYSLKKVSEYKFNVYKDGEHVYDLLKKGAKWTCTCTGYKYRGTCKHLNLLTEDMLNGRQLHGVYARRAQIQKSYDVWKQRYEENPTAANKKQFDLRAQQLEEINKRCEEEDKKPAPQRHPREEFLGVEESLNKILKGFTYEIVGSWRRGKESYKDCDILVVTDKSGWGEIRSRLENDENFGPAPGRDRVDFGDEVIRGGYRNGDRVDYLDVNRVPDPNEYGAWLLFRTGSAAFNIAMRGWLKKSGCGLNERGLLDPDGNVVASKTEEDIFNAIGIPFIDPKDREDAKVFYSLVKKYCPDGKPKFLSERAEDSTQMPSGVDQNGNLVKLKSVS